MTESEKKIFDLMDNKTKVLKFWMPIVWSSNLINRARLEKRMISDHMVQTILTELSDFRRKLGKNWYTYIFLYLYICNFL